jgi:hypothetical protein
MRSSGVPPEVADGTELSPRDVCEILEARDRGLIVIQTKFNQILK